MQITVNVPVEMENLFIPQKDYALSDVYYIVKDFYTAADITERLKGEYENLSDQELMQIASSLVDRFNDQLGCYDAFWDDYWFIVESVIESITDKGLVKPLGKHAYLFRDPKSGLAWIEDGSVGLGYSVHPNIDSSGSPEGMVNLGYWGREDRTVESHGFIYNIDRFVCDSHNPFERILADECQCAACCERREKEDRA